MHRRCKRSGQCTPSYHHRCIPYGAKKRWGGEDASEAGFTTCGSPCEAPLPLRHRFICNVPPFASSMRTPALVKRGALFSLLRTTICYTRGVTNRSTFLRCIRALFFASSLHLRCIASPDGTTAGALVPSFATRDERRMGPTPPVKKKMHLVFMHLRCK